MDQEKINTSESPKGRRNKKNKGGKYFKGIFLVLVAIFLVRYFYLNYESYKNLDVSINWGIFAIAVIMHFLYKVMLASLWHYITLLNGSAIRYRNSVLTYLYSILGKYIPGKFFMLLARIPAYEEEGVPACKVTVCFFLENLCTLLGAAFLFLISLLFFPNNILKDYQGVTFLLIVVFVLCINPKIINFFLRLFEKVIKKDLQIQITYLQMIKVVALFIINWIVLGTGFYIVTCSIYPIPVSKLLYVSGIFGLSVIIGILAIFAPSGLGVREGIMVLGLSAIMPQEYAIIISIISRLWMTVSELSVIGIAWLIDMYRKSRVKKK